MIMFPLGLMVSYQMLNVVFTIHEKLDILLRFKMLCIFKQTCLNEVIYRNCTNVYFWGKRDTIEEIG